MKPTTEFLRTTRKRASSVAISIMDNPRTTLALFVWLLMTYAGFPFYMSVPACAAELVRNDSTRLKILLPYVLATFLAGIFAWKGDATAIGVASAVSLAFHMTKTSKTKPYESVNPFVVAVFSVLLLNDPLQSKWTTTLLTFLPKMNDANMLQQTRSTVVMITAFFLVAVALNAIVSKRISYLLVGNLAFLLGTANYFVLSITGKPFMFSDFKKASTAFGVIGNVAVTKPTILRYLIAVVALVAFEVFAAKTRIKNPRPSNRRLCVEAGIAAFVVCASISFRKNEYLHYYANLNYEYVTSLLIEYGDSVERPTYEDEFERIENLVDDDGNGKVETTTVEPSSETPNVIAIMSEAFCDMTTVGDFEIDEPYIPFTKKTTEESPHGITYSSVFGNNTVSTELSFLTGIPTCLTASGAEVFENMSGKDVRSLTTPFERNGYATVGMHPYYMNGYNRSDAWDALGFDETMFIRDFEDAETAAGTGYVTDEALFERAVEKTKDEKRPLFEFVVTMQNHASYEHDVDHAANVVDGPTSESFRNYVSLQNQSDEALRNLLERIDETGEPTVVMFFGDHLPMLGDEAYESLLGKKISDLEENETRRLYAVPYFVWSSDGRKVEVPEETSMNRLGSILLDAAGIEDEWFDYVDETCERYPILTDCFFKTDGEWSSENLKNILKKTRNDENDPTRDLKQYQVYCVDLLDGRKGEEE